MQKKIAVAVDGSSNSSEAMRYAAFLYTRIPDLCFVLLNIQPTISLYLLDEAQKSVKARQAVDKIAQSNREAAIQILKTHQDRLMAMGVEDAHIEIKTQIRMIGVANDILSICQSNGYDALLVGRRGISRFQELMTGSVTSNLIEHTQLIPVWVIDGKAGDMDNGSSQDILLAADGSQGALRALDHLCFIISETDNVQIHILHVQPKFSDYCSIDISQEIADSAEEIILSGDRHCIDDFMAQAKKMIAKYGIENSRVHIHTQPKHLSTAHTILEEVEKGGYGTIVLGRRGIGRSLFTGSVSRKVLQRMSDAAVWIVP